MTEQQVIQIITSVLSDSRYGKESFTFHIENQFDSYKPDLIIKAGKKNIAAVEVKGRRNLDSATASFVSDYYFLFKVRYFIYTDGERFLIYDRFKNPKEYIETSVDGFVRQVSRLRSQALLNKLKSAAADILIRRITDAANQFPELAQYASSLKNKIVREIKLSSDYMLYFDGGKTDTNSFEHQFFRHLLDNNVPENIYRYCAFGRAFQILNDNTIAMLGLPGMNDTTEPNYVDNYLNDSDNEPWDMPPQSRAAINRRFIMSCTTLPDDLMQWRLYGEDGKGACLKFEPKKMLEIAQQFYLGKVKYADAKGRHPELLFLKSIITDIKKKLLFEVKFILLYVWRHFFKPHEYTYEQEIRLLYIHQKVDREKKWIIAEPYSIVNPMVIFDLSKNEFPLRITEVMLGPKRFERSLNKTQLEQMVAEKKRNVSITVSVRNVYR